jgi:hypothetical protein
MRGAAAKLSVPTDAIAEAHARFPLGQYRLRDGAVGEGQAQIAPGVELHPDSWAMWRQAATRNENGLATSPEFWARVRCLGQAQAGPTTYYPQADIVEASRREPYQYQPASRHGTELLAHE